MAKVAAVLTRLSRRRRTVRALVTKDTHQALVVRVQQVHALFGAMSASLAHLETAVAAYNRKAVATGKQRSSATGNRIVQISAVQSLSAFKAHLASADLISQGKDAEAAKHLLMELLATGVKIGVKFSPLRYVKDTAEALEALADIARTTKAARLRNHQVKVATDLLNWLDAVALVTLTWCYAAQLFLLALQGKGGTSEAQVLALVEARVLAATKAW